MSENLTVQEIWKDLGSYKRDAVRLHYENYQMCRDFYRGGEDITKYIRKSPKESQGHWIRRKERLVGVSYCGPIVDKLTRAEIGNKTKISFEDQALTDIWEEMAKINHFNTYAINSARQRNVDGTCVLFPHWDDKKKAVKLDHVLPEHFYPIIGDSYTDIKAVVIDKRFNADTFERSFGNVDKEGEVWIYTPDEVGYFKDGNGEIEPNIYSGISNPLLFSCLNGKRLIGDVFGQSAIHAVALINKAINAVINNAIELIHFQAFSLLVIQSAIAMPTDKQGNPTVDVSMKNFIGLDENGKAYFISPDPKLADIMNVLERLIKMMFEVGGIPQVAIQSQDAHAESGLSRQIQFMPLIDVIEEQRTFDEDVLKQLITTCLEIQAVETGKKAVPDVDGIDIIWSDSYLPQDEQANVDTDVAKENAKLVTHESLVRKYNPDKTDEEIAEIMRIIEKEAQKRIEDSIFERDGWGNGMQGNEKGEQGKMKGEE